MDASQENLNITDFNTTGKEKKKAFYIYSIVFPLTIIILFVIGVVGGNLSKSTMKRSLIHSETKGKEIKNGGSYNILSSGDLSGLIKDTVYTDKDCWLELRINEQMLYQHWRNGTVEKYPVSSGNNKSGDPKALESRPGLFAIFVKEEHHQSSQFSSANMYHFMPFNQGIGFHSIDGTGYYGSLGVRPSSHGCIRMKHEDAKKLYGDCPLGTLVLATKGYSARAIGFAPPGFQNPKEYSKDEYKVMLSSNLYNLLKGKYYVEEREKFIVDPKVIPVSGVYISYDVKIPDKQEIPRSFIAFYDSPDKLNIEYSRDILLNKSSEEFTELVGNDSTNIMNIQQKLPVNSTADLVKEYFNNPIGVLPYFGPKK